MVSINIIKNKINGSKDNDPVTTVQPMTGGSAPTAPPITIFCTVRLLSQTVYTKK